MGLVGNAQGAIKLCILILNHIGAYRYNDAIQHRPHFWWPSWYDLRMVGRWVLHHVGWPLYGRDLLFVPNFWWSLLLECPALGEGLGALCIMDDWMV